MEPIFNFIDISFQLIDSPVDEKVESLLRKLNVLWEYYDKKSTLNNSHSETIIDLFRVCARKDKILYQALEGDLMDSSSMMININKSVHLMNNKPMHLNKKQK